MKNEKKMGYYLFTMTLGLGVAIFLSIFCYRIYEYVLLSKSIKKVNARIISFNEGPGSTRDYDIEFVNDADTIKRSININERYLNKNDILIVYYSEESDKIILQDDFGFGIGNVILMIILICTSLVFMISLKFPESIVKHLNNDGPFGS